MEQAGTLMIMTVSNPNVPLLDTLGSAKAVKNMNNSQEQQQWLPKSYNLFIIHTAGNPKLLLLLLISRYLVIRAALNIIR